MKHLFTLVIVLQSLTILAQCYTSNDFDFNGKSSNATATVCIKDGFITLTSPPTGVVKLSYKTQQSFIDSATKLPYWDASGGLDNVQYHIVVLSTKYISVQRTDNNSWVFEAYNPRLQGLPNKPSKRIKFAYATPVLNTDKTTFKQELTDTVTPDLNAVKDFVVNNLVYPKLAIDNGIEGTVNIKFTVNIDGSLSNVELINSPGYGLESEALRIVKMLPNLKPGLINGNPVPMQCILPIDFKL